ncbi:hypothetical protein LAZ67_12003163 [Cordylochernes scorpioides]|uniref:Reverse transcriptase domain-containing protein n=1 Tax=Cordylochernes scorpioides TaxID=51811 RepID=A0ABY6L2A4_9ARAC|nr:hypothetical protein LAZ67_12003163 [Cordylochernes scorpioides]
MQNNLLSPKQHGFIKSKSTITALNNIIDIIMEHKTKELTALVTIDIAGAFDNAWWPAILKIIDEDNLPESLIRTIQSYFKSRKTKFTYENLTINKQITKGCPQGGPLSPLLWIILLNDLLIKYQVPNSEVVCYADDVSIICWHNNCKDLKLVIEQALNTIDVWCKSNKLEISLEKTNILYLHNKEKIPIKFNNEIIIPTQNTKILGIIIANHRRRNKINFTYYIEKIVNRTKRFKNYLFSICGKSWGLSTQKRLTLYKSIFRPILTYGAEIWFKYLNKKCLQKLNSTQYQILTWCIQAYKSTSYSCVHSLANIPLISDFIESRIMISDLRNLSTDDQQIYDPFIPGIIDTFLKSRMNFLNSANKHIQVEPVIHNVEEERTVCSKFFVRISHPEADLDLSDCSSLTAFLIHLHHSLVGDFRHVQISFILSHIGQIGIMREQGFQSKPFQYLFQLLRISQFKFRKHQVNLLRRHLSKIAIQNLRRDIEIFARKNHHHAEDSTFVRAARNKYLRAINRAKKTSWKICIEENESTNAFGNAYRIFKRLRSTDIQVGIPLLNKTAECMREQKMKEMLTAFFPDDDVRLDNEEHTLIRNHIPSFTNREIIFITEKEIKDLCSNLNIRKAPGPDNVSNYMIKHSLLSILPSLVKLFNECLVLGYYPESWKHSVLKIITKPQKADYEAINSYRPISLTSNFSKIFETIIKNKILNYYNHNNLLSHRQHGFTKRKSTITALDKITETILKHKQNELVALIAIDISGAFDNAWWPALIKRMDEDHVPAVLIKIIQSFLNRRRKTSLTFSNTTISKYLSKGCPQGGPLLPLLWNIVLNDLLINFASPNSEIICYADGVSIVCWHKTIEGLKNETESTLNYVIQWCTRNKLKLSPEKTGLIHMHGKQNIPMGTPNFIIKPVKESKINFTPHINDILCKINCMKNLLFSLCGKMWGLDAKKRLILYKTLFRPILVYGSEIWYKFINKRSKQRLNSQQYQILLWVVRAYKTTSSNCIHSLAKIPILTDHIES